MYHGKTAENDYYTYTEFSGNHSTYQKQMHVISIQEIILNFMMSQQLHHVPGNIFSSIL